MVGALIIHLVQFFREDSFFNMALNPPLQEKQDSLKNRILVQQICDKLGIDPTLDFFSKTKMIEQKMAELEKMKDDLIARNIDTAQRASKIQEALEKQLQAQQQMTRIQTNLPEREPQKPQKEPQVTQEEEKKEVWKPKRQLEMIPPA